MKKKQNESQKIHLKGQLRTYMQVPVLMAVLLAIMNVWIYRIDKRAGLVMLVFVIIYVAIVGVLYLYSRSLIMKDLVEFAAQYGVVQNTLLKELAVPYAILLEDGKVAWLNDQFVKVLGEKNHTEIYLSKYMP